MAAHKKLINRTGHPLRVTLTVRKGDHPKDTAGTVDVELDPAATADAGDTADADSGTDAADGSEQDLTYGNDVDIYLNGIELGMEVDGSLVGQRQIVVERGSDLDRALNTNDTIEFLYDGKQILLSCTNSDRNQYPFGEVPDAPAGEA